MKRLIVIGAVMLMVMGMVSVARAGETDTMALRVTVGATLEVTIFATEYYFGTVALNSTSISTTSTAVKNTSPDATETYKLRVSAGDSGWTIAGSTGTLNNVRIQAIWNTSEPATVPDNASHNLTTSDQTCNGALFAGDETYNGLSEPKGTEEYLWFKLWTPSEVDTPDGDKRFYLTITAIVG